MRGLAVPRCRFLPIVVTNVHAGAGHQFEEVPVVDPLAQHAFFAEERILSWVVEGRGGVEHATETLLYHSPSRADAAIEAYLDAPPQVLPGYASGSPSTLLR